MDPASSVLKERGIRATSGRLRLLERVRRLSHAATAQELHRPQEEDLVSVYRNLALFVEAGIVREVRVPGAAVRYEDAQRGHHHHVVCTGCGQVAELPECDSAQHALPHDVPGFERVDGVSLEYSGVCRKCV